MVLGLVRCVLVAASLVAGLGCGDGGDEATELRAPVIGVGVGWSHSCALLSDGTVACWGDDQEGQLGDGDGQTTRPQQVPGISDAIEIAAQQAQTCALLADGRVTCWGAKWLAEDAPQLYSDVRDAVQLSLGSSHGCAVRRDGRVACWGSDLNGELRTKIGSTLEKLTLLDGVTDVAYLDSNDLRACAVHEDGGVSCWGYGYGGYYVDGSVPPRIRGITDAKRVSGTLDADCVLRANGEVLCWSTEPNERSTPVRLFDDVVALGGEGGVRMCVATRDAHVECFDHAFGGTVERVKLPAPASSLAVGTDHVCATLAKPAVVYCWGQNSEGQLGTGDTDPRTVPTLVGGLGPR